MSNADGGGGVKKGSFCADVLYGRPLIIMISTTTSPWLVPFLLDF